ncbi:hypothetical protein NQZ68_009959 [Dissostichus eleginoides]|nr:hypothetical protein NQZ68_009959 [Dissostichus eleginoides]
MVYHVEEVHKDEEDCKEEVQEEEVYHKEKRGSIFQMWKLQTWIKLEYRFLNWHLPWASKNWKD